MPVCFFIVFLACSYNCFLSGATSDRYSARKLRTCLEIYSDSVLFVVVAEIRYQGVTVLSNLGNGWGYEMTPAELAKKDEFYSIYWSEYNLVKESGSPELYDKIHNRNNYADI